jgi:hypothetical protein
MDELEISGKRYISSRRAGKEHKYHPDYIGQLVRAGKVAGQKIGRAWYVEVQSLSQYLSQDLVSRGPMEKSAESVAIPTAVKVEEKEHIVIVEELGEPIPVVEEAEAIDIIIKKVEPEQLFEEEKIIEEPVHHFVPIRQIQEEKIPKRPGGLTYMTDDTPLFPAIKKHTAPMTTFPIRKEQIHAYPEAVVDRVIPPVVVKPQRIQGVSSVRQLGFVFLIGVIALFLTMGLSYALSSVFSLAGSNLTSSINYSLK